MNGVQQKRLFRKEPYWVGLKYHDRLQSTLYEKTGIFADEPPCKQLGCVQPTWWFSLIACLFQWKFGIIRDNCRNCPGFGPDSSRLGERWGQRCEGDEYLNVDPQVVQYCSRKMWILKYKTCPHQIPSRPQLELWILFHVQWCTWKIFYQIQARFCAVFPTIAAILKR